MNPARRSLLHGAISSAALTIALVAGLIRPVAARAAAVNQAPRRESGPAGEMLLALQTAQPAASSEIRILVPSIAEDGANVFLECSSSLPEVDGFTIFVDRNPQPLIAAFWIGPGVAPELRTRIKLAQTANVWVVVRSRGQFFRAVKQVVVTVGGCGLGQN